MGESLKFQQLPVLRKYLGSLKVLPRCYLVIHPEREERRNFLEQIAEEIQSRQKDLSILFLEGEESSWGQVYDSLMTPSLFGGEEAMIWNGVKAPFEALLTYALKPSKFAFLLIGAESFKPYAEFYEKTSSSLVLLDFSEEKPWEKQKRVEQELLQRVRQASKTISAEAVAEFFKLCPTDSLLVEQEVDKLICYIGSSQSIGRQDVLAVTAASSIATGWQISESIVFGEGLSLSSSLIDLSFLIGFLGQVRFYLQQGRQVAWCLEEKMSPSEMSKALPTIKSFQLQKMIESLRSRSPDYFEEALSALYEVELLSKNSQLDPPFLFDLLRGKLAYLKKIHQRQS